MDVDDGNRTVDPSPIRVLAMIDDYQVAGASKAVLEFARLASRVDTNPPQVDITILTYVRHEPDTDFTRAIRASNIPIEIVSERYRYDPRVFPQIRAAVECREPDILWTHGVKSHFFVRFMGLHRQRGWVAFHHGYTATDLKVRLYNQMDRWSLRAPDRVMVPCRAFGCELRRRSGVKPERLQVRYMPARPPEPVSAPELDGLRRELGMDEDTLVLLNVGRLSREKGHADLIRAVAAVAEIEPSLPVKLIIVGSGPEQRRLESLRAALHLSGHVIFASYRKDVRLFYALAQLFVLSSHSEGSPNVLMEAMGAGLPIVATAVGGVPEIVTHERDALLVEKGDIKGLARAILRVLHDADLRNRLALAGRETLKRHTPENYYESIRSVFRELVVA